MSSAEESAWQQLISGGVRTELAASDGVVTFVVRAGHGRGPTVFVSGLGDPTPTWATVAPALAESSRVVAYDRPGMGASPPAGSERSLARLGTELSSLLEKEEAGPAVLVGHSLGGLIAMEAYRQAPERVAGIVLIDPTDPAVIGRRGLVAAQKAAVRLPGALGAVGLWPRIARSVARKEAAAVACDPSARVALERALLENLVSATARKTTGDELDGVVRSIREGSDPTRGEPMSVPLTVLSASSRGGSKKARATWTEAQRRLADRSRSGRHQVVDGGHYLHREHPEVVVEAVQQVWDRILAS